MINVRKKSKDLFNYYDQKINLMPKKIPFQVIYSSSADEQYQADELNHHGPYVNGWQSTRLCSYPQELILQFENHVRLKRVQLLSHQSLIGNHILFLRVLIIY